MDFLIGGVSAVHDALLAAAFRQRGVSCTPVPPPTRADLAVGRALLPRGHPNTVYSLSGAVVRAIQARQAEFATVVPSAEQAACAYVLPECEYWNVGADVQRAFGVAGIVDASVVTLPVFEHGCELRARAAGVAWDEALEQALTESAAAGDILVRLRGEARITRADRSGADAIVDACVASAVRATERGRLLTPTLEACASRIDRLAKRPVSGARVRVRITGDFVASLSDGDPGADIVSRLERLGADVECATYSEWVLFRAWEARNLASTSPDGPGAAMNALRARHIESAVRRTFESLASAARLTNRSLPDMDEVASIAAPYYRPELRGGTSHLEVGIFLRTARAHSADLVISVKPFASIPSSAVSDSVLYAIAQQTRGVSFLSLETTGDADAQIASRLELAVDAARANVASHQAPWSDDSAADSRRRT